MRRAKTLLLGIAVASLTALLPIVAKASGDWTQESGKRIAEANLFDVCVVALGDGRFRLYGELYGDIVSYISSDGVNWQREEGTRIPHAGFPFVMRLPNGKWRIYYNSMEGEQTYFLSAISDDGLSFTVEEGHRYDASTSYEENIQSPRVVALPDGRYRMYFTAIEHPMSSSEVLRILSAISSDGLNFTLESGVRIDPTTNDSLFGTRVAHAWPVVLSDGSVKLYFAGATEEGGGILSATSSDGLNFTVNREPEIKNWANDKVVQDPCVAFTPDAIRLYYGVYNGPAVIPESAIYSATQPYPPMPLPSSQASYQYPIQAVPTKALAASGYHPMGLGTPQKDSLDLRVELPSWEAAADVYLGLYLPAIDPNNIYLFWEDGSLHYLTEGMRPWVSDTRDPIVRTLFSDIPTETLPQGAYYFMILVSPHGDIGSFYLWTTSFEK